VIASHATLVAAAVVRAKALGYRHIRVLPPSADDLEAAARRLAAEASRLRPHELVISGGEPTVWLPRSHGRGGRNQQLALCVARALGHARSASHAAGGTTHGSAEQGRAVRFLSVASDGEDGATDAAGAVVDQSTWSMLQARGLDPARSLRRADAYPLLAEAGLLVRTGATGTNVLDLHLLERCP